MTGTGAQLTRREVDALARSWRGGVSAGALLMRCSAAAGEVAAGRGTVAVPTADGRAEVRASVDGTPTIDGPTVSMSSSTTVPRSLDGTEATSRYGGLRVGGHVTRDSVRATGDMVIEGTVDRSDLHAGRTLVIEGRASGAHLHAGAGAHALQRAHRPAGDAAERLALMVGEYGQLAAVAEKGGRAASATDMLCALADRRHPDLINLLDEAVTTLSDAQRGWPELLRELTSALTDAARLLGRGRPTGGEEPLETMERCMNVIAAAVPRRRPTSGDLRVDRVEDCSLITQGSVRIAGRGARASTIVAADDVYAVGQGCVIQSGSIQAGGVVRASELSGTEGSWLTVEFAEPRPIADLLRADVVHAGVEVNVAGQLVRFDRRRDNVRVGIEGGQVALTSH